MEGNSRRAERRGCRVYAGNGEEMFGEKKEEEVVEDVKVKKPRKKVVKEIKNAVERKKAPVSKVGKLPQKRV